MLEAGLRRGNPSLEKDFKRFDEQVGATSLDLPHLNCIDRV